MSAELGLGYSDIQKAAKAINDATKELQQFQNALNKTEQAQARAEAATKRGSAGTNEATSATKGFTDALDSLGELDGPIGDAADALGNLVQTAKGLGAGAASIMGFTGAAVGAAAAIALVGAGASVFATLEFNKQFTELQKLSNEYGVTANQALALKISMESAGVSADDYTDAIGDLSDNLKKSGDDGTKVKEALKELGVKTKDLLNPTQVMSDLTEALSGKMKDGTLTAKDAAAAQEVLGEEWRKGVLAADALRDAQERLDKFKKLGIEVDKNAAVESEKFRKSTADLSLIMGVFGSEVIAKNLPIIDKWTRLIVDSYTEGGVFKKVLDGMKDSAYGFLTMIDRGVTKLQNGKAENNARQSAARAQAEIYLRTKNPDDNPYYHLGAGSRSGGQMAIKDVLPNNPEYNARMAQIKLQAAQGTIAAAEGPSAAATAFRDQMTAGYSSWGRAIPPVASRPPSALETALAGSGRVKQDEDKAAASKAEAEAKKQADLQKKLNELFDDQKRKKDEIYGVDRQRAELEAKATVLMKDMAKYQGDAGKAKLDELRSAYDFNQVQIARIDAERQLLVLQQGQSQELSRMTLEFSKQNTIRANAVQVEQDLRYASSADKDLFNKRIQVEQAAAQKIVEIQRDTFAKVQALQNDKFNLQFPTGNQNEPAQLTAADNQKMAGIDARIQALDSSFMEKRNLVQANKITELQDITAVYERASTASSSFTDGFNKGILKLNDNLGTISSRTDDLTVKMGSALGDHLANALATGTFGAVDFFKTLRVEVGKLIIDLLVMQPLMETIRRATGASSNTGQQGMGLGGLLMNIATKAITGGLMSSPVSTNISGFGTSVVDTGAAWDSGMSGNMPAFDYGAINQPTSQSLSISVDVSGSGDMSAQNADIIGSQVAQAAMRAIARDEATSVVSDGVRYGGVIRSAMSS